MVHDVKFIKENLINKSNVGIETKVKISGEVYNATFTEKTLEMRNTDPKAFVQYMDLEDLTSETKIEFLPKVEIGSAYENSSYINELLNNWEGSFMPTGR